MAIERFANSAASILASDINGSQSTLVVVSAITFPDSGDFRIIIDSEIMKVIGVSGNTFTVTRGAEGTAATNHFSGADVVAILSKEALAAFRANTIQLGQFSLRGNPGLAGRLYLGDNDSGVSAVDDGVNWNPFGLYNFRLTAVQATDFTQIFNGGGGATFTQQGHSILFNSPANNNTSIFAKALPTEPFTLTVQFSCQHIPVSPGFVMQGLCMRGGNSAICFGWQANGTNRFFAISNFTGASFNYGAIDYRAFTSGNFPENPKFLRVFQPPTGTRIWSFSVDGINWIPYLSHPRNTGTGISGPTHIGFLIRNDTINANPAQTIIRSWEED